MKKIVIKSLLAFAVLGTATSCIEETFPTGGIQTSDQVSENGSAIEAMLNSLPAVMTSSGTIGLGEHMDFGLPGIHLMTEFMLEDLATMGANAAYNRFYPFTMAWRQGPDQDCCEYFWRAYYGWIKTANDVIDLVDLNTSDPKLQEVLGQALCYRASFYLDMARLYEPKKNKYLPVTDAIKELTVPIVTADTKEEAAKNNPRAPRKEMYAFILNDLQHAARLLKGKSDSYTVPTEAAANGLMARAYLEMGAAGDEGAYDKAIHYADLVLSGSGKTPLTQKQWEDPINGFNDGSANNAWIWGLPVSGENVNNLLAYTSHISSEAQYGYCQLSHIGISKALYELISDKDFRKHSWLDPKRFDYYDYKFAGTDKEIKTILEGAGQVEPIMDYATLKFRVNDGAVTDYKTGNAADHVLMRIEEMYFIKAEALAQLDRLSEASEVLNKLVKTRYSDQSYDSSAYTMDKDSFLEHMLLQKRIEFWGEGILFFDYKRLDHGITRAYKGSNHAAEFALNCEGRSPQWNICVTKAEFEHNNGITDDTNNPDPTQFVVPTPFEK